MLQKKTLINAKIKSKVEMLVEGKGTWSLTHWSSHLNGRGSFDDPYVFFFIEKKFIFKKN